MGVLLQVEGLVKHFPVHGSRQIVQAVNGIQFSVDAGETLALVGESGSGKTTVGRCVLGLVAPTAGRIQFAGREMGRHWNVRSRGLRGKMQLVFQEPAESLDPRMPVGVSLEEPLLLTSLSLKERSRRVRRVLDQVNLPPGTLGLYPAELSAGHQQRIAIARAIITEPELLVLDEPTSALDPTARAEIIDLLIEIQKQMGTAYLFISHDLSTVHYISHRIAVMYLGRIIEEGPSHKVFREPHHPYSVGLISSVLLPGPGLRPDKSFTLDGEIPSPINIPSGCPLVSRCPFRIERCAQAFPSGEVAGKQHFVHCYQHVRVAAQETVSDRFAEFQRMTEKLLDLPVKQ
jgi:oligopeptide/dipeptide ABC transporter ATP-binding protein